PRNASGTRAMMIRALKITAASTALCGVCNPMMFSCPRAGYVAMNMAGMIAKYFATSLAMEKVVSAPRVMSNCLPMATTSMSLVGLLSRSTMLPAFLGGHSARIHGYTHIGLRQGRRVVRAVSGHGHQPALGLLLLDVIH